MEVGRVLAAGVAQGICIVVVELEVGKLATADSRRWRIPRSSKLVHSVSTTEHLQQVVADIVLVGD